ncbi:MAG: hypothetical protein QOJ42_3353 [Acidobacteriaceae bacterium]|jgi:hypothetical protein|nr:hypothetical protein [Acidobacteriaceae bacterium]
MRSAAGASVGYAAVRAALVGSWSSVMASSPSCNARSRNSLGTSIVLGQIHYPGSQSRVRAFMTPGFGPPPTFHEPPDNPRNSGL